jgi:hypothetical protein
MKLVGYPDEIVPENVAGSLEINHCWIYEGDDTISIQHKYWNGHEMKLFCDLMAVLGTYLHFEIEYLSAEKMRSIGA